MQLPINDKDLETIINALALGGDTRLYHLLKNIKEDRQLRKEVRYVVEVLYLEYYNYIITILIIYNNFDVIHVILSL